VVKELLLKDERVNPSAEDDHVIRLASQNGHVNVVKGLIKDELILQPIMILPLVLQAKMVM